MSAAAPPPPVARTIPKRLEIHGDVRIDNYFWLRDRDEEAIAYLVAENEYATACMQPTVPLQIQLFEEMLGRIKEDDCSVPVRVDDWFYYTRTEKDRGYPIYCRKRGTLDAPEEIYLDCNPLAEGQRHFRIGAIARSPDHNLLAYSTDLEGNEEFTIFVKDLRTGALLDDRIPNTSYSLQWTADSRAFFHTALDETKRPHRVYLHRIGEATADRLVYEETDARFEIDIAKSRSRDYIFLNIDSALTSEVRYLRADQPGAEFVPVLRREQGVEYEVEQQGEWFYILTNEGAQNFRLLRTPAANPSKSNWTEVIAGLADVTIEAVDAFRDFLVVSERHRGLERIRYARVDALQDFQSIGFPDPVYTAGVGGNAEYASKVLRFTYASLSTPPSVFDFDLETGERVLRKRDEFPGYDSSLYRSERLFARAPDGVEVPISLVYRKDLASAGSRPLLLDGYGAYGAANDPGFESVRVSLLDRGFTYAMAHVRGGGDLGKYWHEHGRLLSKKNTFTDFIACAEHLIAHGYAAPDRLAIAGGSAGGLLIGAAVNMRPDLFRAAVARAPFVDVVNTMLDPTLPLTIGEWEEWGDPSDPEVYRYLLSYSPYDNVEAKPYPAMLVKCGLNDPRVPFWEPAKWVAKLRATKTDDHVLLLRTNMGAGHFGPSGRYPTLRELAFDFAFLISQVELSTAPNLASCQ